MTSNTSQKCSLGMPNFMVSLLTGKTRGIQWSPPIFIQWLHWTLRSLVHNWGHSVLFPTIFSSLVFSKTVEMTTVAKLVELKAGSFEVGTANLQFTSNPPATVANGGANFFHLYPSWPIWSRAWEVFFFFWRDFLNFSGPLRTPTWTKFGNQVF